MLKTEQAVADFKEALLSIDRVKATAIFEDICDGEISFEILETVIMNTLEIIGDQWEKGDVSLAQVYMSGIICEELIKKYIPEKDALGDQGMRLAIGVLLDHHGLGKRIVLSVLRAAGYEVLDLGEGLTAEQMAREAIANKIDVLMVSTLMLHSALEVKKIKEQFAAHKYDGTIIVGGAPFRLDPELWREVGADCHGKNASTVVSIIRKLTENQNHQDQERRGESS